MRHEIAKGIRLIASEHDIVMKKVAPERRPLRGKGGRGNM
jgi:hypothetical protein